MFVALLMGQLLLKLAPNKIYYRCCFPRPPAAGGEFPHFGRHLSFFRNPIRADQSARYWTINAWRRRISQLFRHRRNFLEILTALIDRRIFRIPDDI